MDTKPVYYHPAYLTQKALVGRSVTGNTPISLYVHIPFCATRCHFCTFAIVTGSRVREELVTDYLAALKTEMTFFAATLREQGVPIETIQIGGGTPTMLSAAQLEQLLSLILELFDGPALKELIIEGFPTSITEEKLAVLAQVSRLRLNIGIQTFSDDHLDKSGRRHSLTDAVESLTLAKESGIASVGADIIVGLPGSTVEDVVSDLRRVATLGVNHLAFYPLWVYGETALGRQIRNGKRESTDFQSLRTQHLTGLELLAELGYERYTSFHYTCSEDHKHQYGLWQMNARDWLGFGMAAMTHLNGHLYTNEPRIHTYIEKINSGLMNTGAGQRLSPREHMQFTLLYGLRLRRYPFDLFRAQFGCSVSDVFDAQLHSLAEDGLITYHPDHAALTHEGILALGNIEERINRTETPSGQVVDAVGTTAE